MDNKINEILHKSVASEPKCLRLRVHPGPNQPRSPPDCNPRTRPAVLERGGQVRLLDPNGTRPQFDGTELSNPGEVLAALDRLDQTDRPRKPSVEVELRPVGA